ncbi:MAG: hypothetical protein ACK5P7_02505 [Bdellovibrio sp.]
MPRFAGPRFKIFVLSAGWMLNTYFFFSVIPWGPRLGIYLVYPLLLGLGFYVFSAGARGVWITALCAAAGGLLTWISINLYAFSPERFLTFWFLKPHYLVLQILLIRFLRPGEVKDWSSLLAPTFAARGLIIPDSAGSAAHEARNKLWWQGFLNIVLGLTLALIRIGFEENLNTIKTPLIYMPMRYVLAVLGLMSFLNILSGLIRIFGISILDATNFVWLSRSPAEYWRRGSVYSYLLLQKYIYLPLLARTRRPRLSRLIAFFLFINIKIGFLNYLALALFALGFSPFESADHFKREIWTLIQWTLWFVVLEFSLIGYKRTRVREKAGPAWRSVLLTHVTMSLIYLMSYFIYFMVK